LKAKCQEKQEIVNISRCVQCTTSYYSHILISPYEQLETYV